MTIKTVMAPLGRGLAVVLTAAAVSAALVMPAQAQAPSVEPAASLAGVPANPQKTVVLDLALLDVLHSLGVPVAAVSSGRFEGTLAPYGDDSVPKVGSMFEPDAEAIRALGPDFILTGRRSAKALPDLQQLAPAANLAFNQAQLIDSVKNTTQALAALYGKQDQADALLAKLDASVNALQKQAAGAGKGLLVLTTNGKVIAQGPDSRFGVLFNDYGVQPALTEFPEGKGVALTGSLLQELNPDWIYVIDRDASLGKHDTPAAQLLEALQVANTTAGQKQHMVYLNPANWYLLDGAGLGAVQENVDQLLQALGG